MTFRSRSRLATIGLVAALLLSTAPAGFCGDSLYVDLGGKTAIAKFVREALNMVVKDPRIAGDFDDINLDWLHHRLTLFICQLTGGPCRYPGRELYAAHKGLHLATREFNAFAEDLQIAMDRTGIPYHTQNRLLALLAPMEHQVVSR